MLHHIETSGWEANTAWCVPTSVSFLTGVPLIHAHSRAAFIQDKKLSDVKGVYASEALLMLGEQDYKAEQICLTGRYSNPPTLKKFLSERTAYETCMPMMIQIEDSKDFCHMITAHYQFAADNHTMKPVSVEVFPHLQKYVTGAWIVSKM